MMSKSGTPRKIEIARSLADRFGKAAASLYRWLGTFNSTSRAPTSTPRREVDLRAVELQAYGRVTALKSLAGATGLADLTITLIHWADETAVELCCAPELVRAAVVRGIRTAELELSDSEIDEVEDVIRRADSAVQGISAAAGRKSMLNDADVAEA